MLKVALLIITTGNQKVEYMSQIDRFALSSISTLVLIGSISLSANAAGEAVSDDAIAQQRQALAEATNGAGFGPQSPRDIDSLAGNNALTFEAAPVYTQMNLCNIHFHESAEHKGGDFTRYIGNGNGSGYQTGFAYSGELSEAELAPLDMEIGDKGYGGLVPGDTVEVHYVHSSAQVTPGPTLAACLSESIMNPQLRVETQVYVLVNDSNALDFVELAAVGESEGFQQALNIPSNTGTPVQYAGSTTGPNYNEAGSPLQVTWSVRPEVAKVNIHSVAQWFSGNVFEEDHAHGVRNLVINPDLLSTIN